MRDDLHKSLPPRTAWARVLRLVSQRAEAQDVQDALVRAVQKDATWLTGEWGRKFSEVLEAGRGELFALEKIRGELHGLVDRSPTPHARAACEMALGVLAREGSVPSDFRSSMIDKALRTFATDCIEHVGALVAKRFDAGQAAQVSRTLRRELASCELDRHPPKRESKSGRSVDSALSIPLDLSL